MQVSETKLPQFRQRVLSEYKESDAYHTFRHSAKFGYRQRDSSIAILTYILNKGGDNVRWSELKDVFGLGGDHRDRKALEVSLRDNELNRILKNLVVAGFIEKEEVHPPSTRTRNRNKPDVYYRYPLIAIHFDEMEGGENLDMDQWRESAAPYMDNYNIWLLAKPRAEIIKNFYKFLDDDEAFKEFMKLWGGIYRSEFSDEEERAGDLERAAREWANALPDTKWRLRAQILNYLDADGIKESGWTSPQAFERVNRSGRKRRQKPSSSEGDRSHDL